MKRYFLVMLIICLYSNIAFAKIDNGEDKEGYYTKIYTKYHPIASTDKHSIYTSLFLYRQLQETRWEGLAYGMQTYDCDKRYFNIGFFADLTNKDDPFTFDKSRSITAHLGFQTYTLKCKVKKYKDDGYVWISIDLSPRFISLLQSELLQKNANIYFDIPIYNGKTCTFSLTELEKSEMLYGIDSFIESLQ